MSMDQNDETAAAVEAMVEGLTSTEAVLFYGAGICRFYADVLQAMQQQQEHPNGIYRPVGSVLTLSGQPTEVALVAVKIPVFALQEFAIAHARARKSPEGEALSAKIESFRPPAPK
jgi:hypothetical protein